MMYVARIKNDRTLQDIICVRNLQLLSNWCFIHCSTYLKSEKYVKKLSVKKKNLKGYTHKVKFV